MKSHSKHLLRRTLSLLLMCAMVLSLLPAVAFAAGERAAGQRTYYVSISGKGGNNGLSESAPLPGLDAVPWSQLLPGDRVLLKKGDTFPGAIRMVDIHGEEGNPVTIGTYGTGAAPVIETRGQGIWLPKTGNVAGNVDGGGKYVSSGVTLYDCSYITVRDLHIVNVPDAMKTNFDNLTNTNANRSGDKMTYSGIGVAATDVGAAVGITLTGITVQGDADVQTVKTDTSSAIATSGVTRGATVAPRTYTNANRAYYVSSLSGSDSNDGSSPDKAFYSLHKINELDLQPGAKVYLERGSAFENQYLHIEGGGSEAQPIIIDAYGADSAPKPQINTNGEGVWYQNYRRNLDNAGHVIHGYVSSCVLLYDVPYVEVRNIAMTNFGRYGETPAADPELAARGSFDAGTVPGETGYAGAGDHAGDKVGCYQWQPKMNRTGVAGVAQNKGTITHTVLRNLDIENIFGNIINKHMNNGGIYFTVFYPLNESETGIARYDDLRIEGCYLKRVSRWGIAAIHTTYFNEVSSGTAIQDAACQKYGATNVYIGHNYLEEVGGDPITLMHAYEPLTEYNVSQLGGREMSSASGTPRYINGTYFHQAWDVSAGIWPWKCKTAVFEHNECYTMMYGDLGGNGDCQAWDADSGDSTIYQYNYSAGNTGGCVMFCYGQAYNTVFRYNISYKDGMSFKGGNNQGVLDIVNDANGQITHNTFIMGQGTPANRPGHSGPAHIENNIFYNLGSAYDPSWTRNASLTYNNNLYVGFSTTPTIDSNDITAAKNTLFADPTFADAYMAPANDTKDGLNYTPDGVRNWARDWDTDFNMFKLKDTTNAAVNAGVPHNYTGLTQDADFGVPRVDNDKDFYGNKLDDVHDIGAHDTQTEGGELPPEALETGNELVSSLYELRGDPKTELQVPFTTNNPMSVEDFVKGLTVSEGATVEVYDGTTKLADTDNLSADMTVKIVAADGTENATTYTIKNKNSYNHKTDFVGNQQGNVWFHQTRQASTGDLVTLTSYGGQDQGWWTGSNNTCAEYKGAGDDDTASRTYNGTGFVFRAPATGTVTVSFPEMPKFRYESRAFGNSFDTDVIIYLNGKQVANHKYRVPKPATQPSATDQSGTAVTINPFDLVVVQGDTIEIMAVNSGTFTSAHSANSADVLFNVAVEYKDEAVNETPDDTKKPTAPRGLSARNITADSADLRWLASTDNVGVDFYRITLNDEVLSPNAGDPTYALTGLTADTAYTVTVQAVDEAGNESGVATVTFRTAKGPDTQAPTVPSGGKTVSAKSTSATIAWDPSTDDVGVDHYEVTVNGKTETVRNITQVTISGLESSKTYTASVKAVDAAGNASAAYTFNFSTAAPDTQKPTTPGNVSAPQVGKTTATVRWDPSTDNEGVTGYKVKLGEDGEAQDVGDVLTYVIDGLEGFTEYTAYVCAYDEAGNESAWATVDFQTTGSSECEMISTLFEVSGGELKIPYTDNNPLTVEELRAAFEVSEDAKVKVFDGDTEVTGNVTAGMTVKIVAQDGTVNPTTYTTAQKNGYNHKADWQGKQQGNVWFNQYKDSDGVFQNWTLWNDGYGCYSDANGNAWAAAQPDQACDDLRETGRIYHGSGFTFRAPADGMVEVSFPIQPVFNGTPVSGQCPTYLIITKNGVANETYHYTMSTTAVNVPNFTVSMAAGDTLEFMVTNGTGKGNQNAVRFNPAVTYLDQEYKPEPKSIELSESDVLLFTNTSDQEKLPHTIQLTATVLPEGADQTVTWHSSKTNVATVENGLVTAVADGFINISATVNKGWGSFTANCTVEVRTRIEEITVKQDGEAIGDDPIKVYVNKNDDDHPSHVELTTTTVPSNPTHRELNWTQPAGTEDMIALDMGDNSATVEIDAVGTEVDVGEVTVRVESAEHPDVYTDFKVHVIRYLDNDIFITGDAKVGSTLTASDVELVMTDEGKAGLQYQWYRGAVSEANKIAGATGKQYEVTAADIGATLYVTATADPATFYEGTRPAHTEAPVAKMAGPAAPTGLEAVNCTEGNGGQITGLDAAKVYQYKAADATEWTEVDENSTSIDDLPAGTYQVRIAGTTTQEAGKAATVTIMAAGVTAYTITVDPDIEGGVIEISASQAAEGTEITVTATPDTGYELVENSLTYTYTDGEGTEQTTAVTGGKFNMPAYNVTITAQFKKKSFTITHSGLENVTCSLGEDVHTVEYGDKPNIKLTANDGYTMPGNMKVTYMENGVEKIFRGYEYSRSEADPDTATLKFTSGITANLIVSATIPEKTFAVGYTLKNGLKAPTANAPRTVGYKKDYSGKLVAEDPTKYTLPLGVQVTMDGETFTDFDYDSETGVITIAEGKITGDLVITASGVDATVPVKPVTGVEVQKTLTVQVGKSLTLTATVKPADATLKDVVWQSAEPAIATVDASGKVTGVAEGETEIIVTTVDGGETAICKVTVTKATTSNPPSSSASSGSSTKTETREDGTKVTTVTTPDGTVTETVKQPDGTTSETVTTPEGDTTITVTDPEGEELVKTEIPATIPEPEDKFVDLDQTPWAEEAINNVAGLKLVNGIGGNKYDPVTPMTRGALATVLHRLSNGKTDYKVAFKDVLDNKYYTEGVAWAAKANVVKGISEDIFAPDQIITREQLATMLCRYAKLIGMDTAADASRLESFADGDTTGVWAVDGVAWCVEKGILKGKGLNNLDPTADVSRAEVAVMLDRFIALIQK